MTLRNNDCAFPTAYGSLLFKNFKYLLLHAEASWNVFCMRDNFVHHYYSRQDWSRLKSESQSVLFQQVRCRTPNHSSTFKSDVVQMVNRPLSFITSLVKSVYYIIIYMWWGVDCGAVRNHARRVKTWGTGVVVVWCIIKMALNTNLWTRRVSITSQYIILLLFLLGVLYSGFYVLIILCFFTYYSPNT